MIKDLIRAVKCLREGTLTPYQSKLCKVRLFLVSLTLLTLFPVNLLGNRDAFEFIYYILAFIILMREKQFGVLLLKLLKWDKEKEERGEEEREEVEDDGESMEASPKLENSNFGLNEKEIVYNSIRASSPSTHNADKYVVDKTAPSTDRNSCKGVDNLQRLKEEREKEAEATSYRNIIEDVHLGDDNLIADFQDVLEGQSESDIFEIESDESEKWESQVLDTTGHKEELFYIPPGETVQLILYPHLNKFIRDEGNDTNTLKFALETEQDSYKQVPNCTAEALLKRGCMKTDQGLFLLIDVSKETLSENNSTPVVSSTKELIPQRGNELAFFAEDSGKVFSITSPCSSVIVKGGEEGWYVRRCHN